ncbi:NUDIX hydrolase [Chitinimonas sp.]|uniref:NUDIX hydrolase n=1 Tax=Chitinimonas sp. TaxID=1934313 RepID=UPI002F94B46E
MSDPVWKPNSTVAAVIEHDGRYLLVEELQPEGLCFNQPAGHVEQGEALVDACVREALEETGYRMRPTALVGIYQWTPPTRPGLTYLRFAYAAELLPTESLRPGLPVSRHDDAAAGVGQTAVLDEGIVRAVWLSYEEVLACREQHRSPLVLQCIDDHRAGRRFPLDLIRHYE